MKHRLPQAKTPKPGPEKTPATEQGELLIDAKKLPSSPGIETSPKTPPPIPTSSSPVNEILTAEPPALPPPSVPPPLPGAELTAPAFEERSRESKMAGTFQSSGAAEDSFLVTPVVAPPVDQAPPARSTPPPLPPRAEATPPPASPPPLPATEPEKLPEPNFVERAATPASVSNGLPHADQENGAAPKADPSPKRIGPPPLPIVTAATPAPLPSEPVVPAVEAAPQSTEPKPHATEHSEADSHAVPFDLEHAPFLIQTRGLVKQYGGRRVVNGVDIHVKAGEVVGLLGKNGAGKTTTFYMIVGLVAPTLGHVYLGDEDVTRMPMYRRARHGIGYLPQEESIFRKLSVEDNLLAILETLPISEEERENRCDELLRDFGLEHVRENIAITLSGGEKRRVTIARALVTSPTLLLLDEPFSGVDPMAVHDIQEIILHLKERGLGVLITDHNVRETLSVVDRAYIIDEGRVLSEGTREFLLNDPIAREIYLGHRFSM
jgi:lipopolysaccharide export system ATP-binding protein